MEPLLEVKNLKKFFDVSSGELHAVDNVSFCINKGETLGVVGESGCGKSTLSRVVLHLLDSTDGSIYFNGEDVTKVKRRKLSELRKKMGMVFQDPFASLNPRMTIFQIMAEPLAISKACKGKELERRVYEMMDTVGIARRYVNTYPHELDGGRRQRVGIGRALIIEPEFIVCDEPVSALDVSIQAQVINLLLDIQKERGLTYMFVTHDLSVAKFVSTNIMVMYLGEIVEFAPAEELFNNPIHPYAKALLSAVPDLDIDKESKRIPIKGEVVSPINPKPGCRFAPRCSYATEACFTQSPQLREYSPGHQVSCHFAEQINAPPAGSECRTCVSSTSADVKIKKEVQKQ